MSIHGICGWTVSVVNQNDESLEIHETFVRYFILSVTKSNKSHFIKCYSYVVHWYPLGSICPWLRKSHICWRPSSWRDDMTSITAITRTSVSLGFITRHWLPFRTASRACMLVRESSVVFFMTAWGNSVTCLLLYASPAFGSVLSKLIDKLDHFHLGLLRGNAGRIKLMAILQRTVVPSLLLVSTNSIVFSPLSATLYGRCWSSGKGQYAEPFQHFNVFEIWKTPNITAILQERPDNWQILKCIFIIQLLCLHLLLPLPKYQQLQPFVDRLWLIFSSKRTISLKFAFCS